MMTDFRALCAELVDTLEQTQNSLYFEGGCTDATDKKRRNLLAYARTILSQPWPVDDRISELEAELERERLRLAACGVVAMADTPESASKARDMHMDYWSASLDDVVRQVDKLMALRSAIESMPKEKPEVDEYGYPLKLGDFYAS
jgi:hypothetical protein